MNPSERIILALDLPGADEALAWARRFSGRVGMFKIGLRLFTAAGPGLVSKISSGLGPVFLDLKFHDIPNTVAAATREAVGLGASMLTVHASGGAKMMAAACEEAARPAPAGSPLSPNQVRVLAVTVLTSLSAQDLAQGGIARSLEDHVVALAETSWLAGCDGVVASPGEARALRTALGPDALIVTPGIRPPAAGPDDQRRTALARQAIEMGADYLVVGRPILEAPDPEAALAEILDSMESASR